MPADIGFPLTFEHVQSAPSHDLLAAIGSWIDRVNPTCLVHPHGFFVVLLDRSEARDWRFHFWPKGPRTLTSMPAMVHTHDKVVESRIIQGELHDILYDVTDVGTGGQPIYEVEYRGDKYVKSTSNILRRTASRARTSVSTARTLKAGSCYRIEAHAYHEAAVSEGAATATIVCMHSQSPGTVKVLGLDGYPERIEFHRSELSTRECIDFT
jgi:hypothetical protein